MIERLPCGCSMEHRDEVMYYAPCQPDCENYRYAMTRAAMRGLPTRTQMLACWCCGAHNDAFAAVGLTDPNQPSEGDVSICAYCAAVSVFTGAHLLTRRPTAAELAEVMADPDARAAIAAVQRPDTYVSDK